MGTYNIPRNVKGEGKILFIFSVKSMIYSVLGVVAALPLYLIFQIMNLIPVGLVTIAVFALIGFVIGTFKIPQIGILKFTKTVSGENIDDIIKRAIFFKRRGKRIYMYTKEEEK